MFSAPFYSRHCPCVHVFSRHNLFAHLSFLFHHLLFIHLSMFSRTIYSFTCPSCFITANLFTDPFIPLKAIYSHAFVFHHHLLVHLSTKSATAYSFTYPLNPPLPGMPPPHHAGHPPRMPPPHLGAPPVPPPGHFGAPPPHGARPPFPPRGPPMSASDTERERRGMRGGEERERREERGGREREERWMGCVSEREREKSKGRGGVHNVCERNRDRWAVYLREI